MSLEQHASPPVSECDPSGDEWYAVEHEGSS